MLQMPRTLTKKTLDDRAFLAVAPKLVASHADVLRLVTHSSPRTSAERSDHFRSPAVSLCFERTNRESVIGMSG